MDLQPYCGNDPFRPYLSKPFSFGNFTYATNGHIMIRQPRRGDIPEPDNLPKANWDAPFKNIKTAIFTKPRLVLPSAPVEAEASCPQCEGRGFEHDCPDCECTCLKCNGVGRRHSEQSTSTAINGVPFSLRYVRMMLALPGVEIATPKELEPLIFRFDGGVGSVMPMRSAGEVHVETERASAETRT